MIYDESVFFKEATLKLCSSLEIEKALRKCLLYIQAFIPAGQMGFHIYHREEGIVETVAFATPAEHRALSLKIPLSKNGRQQVEDQRSVRIREIDRLGDDPVTGPVADYFHASDLSAIVMDLVLEKTMLGVFSVFNDGKSAFTHEHVNLLSLLRKPCAIALTNSLRYRELKNLKENLADDNQYLQDELNKISGEKVIGANKGLKRIMEMVHQVAPLESPVLLLGETGSGKEVIANTIHHLSLRSSGPFIRVNCGAIPSSLLDSELFGHEKGAFTGAVKRKRGRIERAQGGTLFLDEIGELSAEAQVRLLRVLQEKEIDRVGGSGTIKVNIRIIAATHRDLEKMMAKNTFRADLFYRLRVFPITIPPLRERREDIPELVTYFIEKKSREMKCTEIPKVMSEELQKLKAYHWPGNIRELENAVERSMIINFGDLLSFDGMDQAPKLNTGYSVDKKKEIQTLNTIMTDHIKSVLKLCNGRVEGPKGAAKILDIHPSTLRKKMQRMNIPFGKKCKYGNQE